MKKADHKMPVPLPLRMLRTAFITLSYLAPPLAHRWGVRLFLTPFRFPTPEREKQVLAKAEPFTFQSAGKTLTAYRWGTGDKVVLCMHGWAGRATQFQAFIPLLVKEGFSVVGLDAPGHGKSPGKRTNLLEFAQAIADLSAQLPNSLEAILAHSLGGAASLIAMRGGVSVKRLVMISTPSIGDDIIDTFLSKVGGRAGTGRYLKAVVQKRFKRSFDSLTALEQGRGLAPMPILVVQDEQDQEVRIEHAHALLEVLPRPVFLATQGLGHTRILRDQLVVGNVISFLKDGLSPELSKEPELSEAPA